MDISNFTFNSLSTLSNFSLVFIHGCLHSIGATRLYCTLNWMNKQIKFPLLLIFFQFRFFFISNFSVDPLSSSLFDIKTTRSDTYTINIYCSAESKYTFLSFGQWKPPPTIWRLSVVKWTLINFDKCRICYRAWLHLYIFRFTLRSAAAIFPTKNNNSCLSALPFASSAPRFHKYCKARNDI